MGYVSERTGLAPVHDNRDRHSAVKLLITTLSQLPTSFESQKLGFLSQ